MNKNIEIMNNGLILRDAHGNSLALPISAFEAVKESMHECVNKGGDRPSERRFDLAMKLDVDGLGPCEVFHGVYPHSQSGAWWYARQGDSIYPVDDASLPLDIRMRYLWYLSDGMDPSVRRRVEVTISSDRPIWRSRRWFSMDAAMREVPSIVEGLLMLPMSWGSDELFQEPFDFKKRPIYYYGVPATAHEYSWPTATVRVVADPTYEFPGAGIDLDRDERTEQMVDVLSPLIEWYRDV